MLFAVLPLLFQLTTDTVPKRTPLEMKFAGDIGFVSTSGNTSVQTLNFGNKITAKLGDLTAAQTFNGVYGRSKGKSVTSIWRGSFRVDLSVFGDISVYNLSNYERNVFAGLASRVATSSGLSFPIVRNAKHRLTLEGGATLTRQRGTVAGRRDLDFLGGRAASSYVYQFGPRAQATQSMELLPNFREPEDLRINTETSVTAPITKQVGVKLSYVIRYDGLPQPGFETTDRLFTSGLQISL
jgi:putative salt-induced outer membrane protein